MEDFLSVTLVEHYDWATSRENLSFIDEVCVKSRQFLCYEFIKQLTFCYCEPVLPVSNFPWRSKIILLVYLQMSCSMTNPTKWPVHPAKTWIILGICLVWSESLLSAWRSVWSFATQKAHSEDWSECVDAQADLSLLFARHFDGFVVLRLKFNELWCFKELPKLNHFDTSVTKLLVVQLNIGYLHPFAF